MINILLVDDERIEANLVDAALRTSIGSGYILDFALTVNRAVEALKSKAFDVILLDNMLPKGVSARHSIPLLLPHKGNAEIVLISSIIDTQHLQAQVGDYVDDLVEKFFLKEYFIEKFSGRKSRPAAPRAR